MNRIKTFTFLIAVLFLSGFVLRADDVSQGPDSSTGTASQSTMTQQDEQEIIGNLDLLENYDIINQLDFFENYSSYADDKTGSKAGSE